MLSMTHQKVALLFFTISLTVFYSSSLEAVDEPANCYEFSLPGNPDDENQDSDLRTETWCYRNVSGSEDSVFIYNADLDKVSPEASILVEGDGLITHGSLSAGQVTIHKLRLSGFNPFSIPLEEPSTATPAYQVDQRKLAASANATLQILRNSSGETENLAVQAGRIQASVPKDKLPWKGYWWPYRGSALSQGSSSPLAKYDRLIKAHTGVNPGAQAWEKKKHGDGPIWVGHCNGWAASTILRSEPQSARFDRKSKISFSVSDQKGIAAENDKCVSLAFFGKRYNGKPGDDPADIYPHIFHQVLTYYIGALKKPVAVDYKRGSQIDNQVISGYDMQIQKTGQGTFSVTAKVKIHKYDKHRSNRPGVAPAYLKTYQYTLKQDAQGNLIAGKWKTSNPDFLWVPLSSRDCQTSNPAVAEDWLQFIGRLPRN